MIKGLTDLSSTGRQLNKLGTVRLGIKVPYDDGTQTRPQATDYFVVQPATSEMTQLWNKHYGAEPKTIHVKLLFTAADSAAAVELNCPQNYALFGGGLRCSGDGARILRRPVRAGVGNIACNGEYIRAGEDWQGQKVMAGDAAPCDRERCPWALSGDCRATGLLRFMVSEIVAFGYWELTVHLTALRGINSTISYLHDLTGGQVAGVPLHLNLVPRKLQVPKRVKERGGYKITGWTTRQVYIPELAIPTEVFQPLYTGYRNLPTMPAETPQELAAGDSPPALPAPAEGNGNGIPFGADGAPPADSRWTVVNGKAIARFWKWVAQDLILSDTQALVALAVLPPDAETAPQVELAGVTYTAENMRELLAHYTGTMVEAKACVELWLAARLAVAETGDDMVQEEEVPF